MKDIEKYKNDGWGLSKKCLLEIETILDKFSEPRIIEFGSGISSEFIIDYFNENDIIGSLTSFDDSEEYSTKINDEKLTLNIRELYECSDINFSLMFNEKNYIKSLMKKRLLPKKTRQKNCFYEIKENDINGFYNLVILDGCHGNGRSISFLHLKKNLKSGSHVIIDDYNHYDFVDKFKRIFPKSILVSESLTGGYNQWELGGNYKIFKIIE